MTGCFARAKSREVQHTKTEEELLNNRASLSPVLEPHLCLYANTKDVAHVFFEKSNCYKLILGYLKSLNKVTSCNYRIEFLKQRIYNDTIPDFLTGRFALLKMKFSGTR